MRTISVDVNKTQGKLNRYFAKCIGAGRAGEVMRHRVFEQLKQAKKECGFEYIRFHGLFHEEMNIVSRDENGKLQFHFIYMDMLFDDLLSIGIRPIVELGLMPEIMAKEEKYAFWWKMNISMPKKMEEWYELVYETVKHMKDRYGEEEVAKWYFEVWNEPNHSGFFTESIESYFALYEAAAKAVKANSNQFRVGGPAAAGIGYIDELIEFCENNAVPIDFITAHEYCVEDVVDKNGKPSIAMRPVDYIIGSLSNCGIKLKEKNLPFLVTEWNTSFGAGDMIHDGYYSAPFILETIKRCENNVDTLSYWVFTDIFEELYPPKRPFHGGYGLMTMQSIPKPAYHGFRFLNCLADTQLVCEDASSYVTRSEDELQILFWNCVHPDMQGEIDAVFFKNSFPTKEREDSKISIAGLEKNKEYKVTVQTVGYKMGDSYQAYLDLGYGNNLSVEQVETLKKAAQPKETELCVKSDENGNLAFTLPQTENQVDLVRVAL